jgi:hypothetical protein
LAPIRRTKSGGFFELSLAESNKIALGEASPEKAGVRGSTPSLATGCRDAFIEIKIAADWGGDTAAQCECQERVGRRAYRIRHPRRTIWTPVEKSPRIIASAVSVKTGLETVGFHLD